MALNPQTPGVYVQEISTLPASIVAVPTAVPAFIGYTEKGPANKPTRITSLLEYETTFGGPKREAYSVNGSTLAVTVTPTTFNLYYNLLMFFGNGGGACYIISTGSYSTATPFASSGAFTTALTKAEEADEITLLVIPEAINLADSDRLTVYNAMLTQCNNLQDRFSIFDVQDSGSITADALDFRTNNVGINNLKYGAAYYPSVKTPISRYYKDEEVTITGVAAYATPNDNLYAVKNGVGAYTTITAATVIAGNTVAITQNGVTITLYGRAVPASADEFKIGGTNNETATNVGNAINNHPVLSGWVYAKVAASAITIVSKTGGIIGNFTIAVSATFGTPTVTAGVDNKQNTQLYSDIKAILDGNTYKLTLYPSSAMAGIYASVDNDRGVWKAPANVSVNLVTAPSILINDEAQGPLNIDATAGKSINVIRNFVGRGTLVWGARTLAGNDNEWRYINVRRLFIMAEESCKKASEFVVFEPNDKNTWIRVKGMIGNFLTDLWRDGALAGDKPEQAFYVKVGLGETMTAQDILEGRLIVQVGMAAVRPAEFIILQFQHKLQQA